MKVHHLNCGTFDFPPYPVAAFTGRSHLVGHCLLVETADCLVLVDSGYGVTTVRRPRETLGMGRFGAALDERETAVRQVRALGFEPEEVRHIVLTHLDFDHTGGLSDFPWATVHVHGPELRAAMRPATLNERFRYRRQAWAHNPTWAVNEADGGEEWFGFQAVRDLDGLSADILVVPLIGHTRGHVGVVVDSGDRVLLHAGDSFLFGHEIDPPDPRTNRIGKLYDAFGTTLRPQRRANLRRLTQLNAEHGDTVSIFCSHDPDAFTRMSSRAP